MMLRCQVESLTVFSTHFYCVSQSDWKFSVHKTRRCVKIHVYTEVITNKLCKGRHNTVYNAHQLYTSTYLYGKYTHSRWMNLVSWCLTHWPVGESGQPHNVWRQSQHTDVNTVKARLSELLDLPDTYRRRSSSVSKSLTQIIKNALISTVSSISTGRSLSVYRNTIAWTLQAIHLALYPQLIDWVKVLSPTWHKIGHFVDVFPANLLA